MPSAGRAWAASAAAISAVSLWGLAFPLIQEGLRDFSPVVLGFLRFATASALLLVVSLVKHRPSEFADALRMHWKPVALFGLLYITIPNIAQNVGLQHGFSSVASVIQSSGPVFTLVFAAVLLKEAMTGTKLLGTGIALAGTALLVARNGLSLQDEDFVSNMLLLASAASYALAWVSAKKMLERSEPLVVITLSLIVGTAMLGLTVPFEPAPTAEFTASSAVVIMLLGFLCGSVSTVLFLYALAREEVSRMAFFIYLMPLFASLFAFAIRGEGVAAWTALCGFVIVVGIAIANRRSGRLGPPKRPSMAHPAGSRTDDLARDDGPVVEVPEQHRREDRA
jgi:drug/metabolite transporter (DMT)-like permease